MIPGATAQSQKDAMGVQVLNIAVHPKPCIQGVQGAPPLGARRIGAPGGPPEAYDEFEGSKN